MSMHVPGLPVGAGLGDAVGQVLAVVADRHAGQGDGAVLGPGVRIEQHARLAVERVRDVEDRLVLQAVVADVEVTAARLEGSGILLVVPQFGQAFAGCVSRSGMASR